MNSAKEKELEFLGAVSAVYAWICAIDENVSPDDYNEIGKQISQLPFISHSCLFEFGHLYQHLLKAFEHDYEDGKKRAIALIEPLKFNQESASLLIKLFREAMQLKDNVELIVMKELMRVTTLDKIHAS